VIESILKTTLAFPLATTRSLITAVTLASMSNMYGYSDYNGPQTRSAKQPDKTVQSNDDDDMNPLQTGFWMEGDSMAPPCGTSVSMIHKILEIAAVSKDDVLYDLGAGDGRVCLEAWHLLKCRHTVGVEIEEDLVERARDLISKLPRRASQRSLPCIYQMDLSEALDQLVVRAKAELDAGYRGDQKEDFESSSMDLPLPTVLILYLLPEALLEIQPQLRTLLLCLPETFRIVCNTWGFRTWRAVKEVDIEEGGVLTSVFVYTKESLTTQVVDSS